VTLKGTIMTDAETTIPEAPAPETPRPPREMERRWGKDVIEPGFTFVPSVLLRGQARLRIDAVELAVLVHLIDHWWQSSEMPWPSKRRLAERLMVSEKTIQRAMARLETEGLVKRVARHYPGGGQTSNYYDLSPLVERLRPIAKDMMVARAEAKATVRRAERPGPRRRKAAVAKDTP
jgi:predicted transcriptional regulator